MNTDQIAAFTVSHGYAVMCPSGQFLQRYRTKALAKRYCKILNDEFKAAIKEAIALQPDGMLSGAFKSAIEKATSHLKSECEALERELMSLSIKSADDFRQLRAAHEKQRRINQIGAMPRETQDSEKK